eukprot:c16973_g1_i1.p2 GENE.c16973_g1_i1~~c16973_g1_i1.p2  ORF type:complete len:190 (+),score=49.35 c16973_g1_i1:22-570(+)
MGACASGMGGSPIDAETLQRMAQICSDKLSGLPDAVQWEKYNIIWEMWRKSFSDKPYELELPTKKTVSLDYKKYPENEAEINNAAIQVACSNALKEALGDILHEAMDASVTPKFPANALARKAAQKAYDKSIESTAEKAIDKMTDKIVAHLEKVSKEKGPLRPTENDAQPTENPHALKKAVK